MEREGAVRRWDYISVGGHSFIRWEWVETDARISRAEKLLSEIRALSVVPDFILTFSDPDSDIDV